MLGKLLQLHIAVLIFLPTVVWAADLDYAVLISIDNQARFSITTSDGNQYGSTKSDIISDLDSPYIETFTAQGQSIFLDTLQAGEYQIDIDSYYEWESELYFEIISPEGVNSVSFDYVTNAVDSDVPNPIIFTATVEGLDISQFPEIPTGIAIENNAGNAIVSWDRVSDAQYYALYYQPDTFPFYRILATTTAAQIATGHPWADYSGNPDFPENLYTYRAMAHYPDGTYSFLSASVSNDDADGDRIPDYQELIDGTDPNGADTDNDGLSDFYEKNRSYTDPLIADTDNDGFSDGAEDEAGTIGIDALSTPPQPTGTCTAPQSGDWFVDTWCSITENQFVDQNLVLLKGAYLVIRENIKIFVDFVNHNVQLRPGSRVEIEDGASISSYPE